MIRSNVFQIVGDSLSVARLIAKNKGFHKGAWYFISFRTRGFIRFLFDCYSWLYARTFNKPLIHVIGDSHGKVFRGNRLFVVHHLGAATAHNLVKKNSATNSSKKVSDIIKNINRNDYVVLSFGEIDCRVHIYYQYKKHNESKSIEVLIDDTLTNYGKVMTELKEEGVNFIVYGVPPATKVRNEYRYPFYATPEIHSQISRSFNEKLKALCERNGYGYIDMLSQFSDADGFMLPEYAADEIHLSNKVVHYAKGEISKTFGIKF